MPVKKDPSGRRYVQSEAEVPGTPEQVWNAIATGPGISSWFVPTSVEEKVGGKISANFGPGMDATSKVTEWEPPRKFSAVSQDRPDAPEMATEWTVEARDGGTCVVRVVHSWFASSDDWDNQYEGTEHGWRVFFRALRIYLQFFRGHVCTAFMLMGMTNDPPKAEWPRLMASLGLQAAALNRRVQSAEGAPQISGIVESLGPAEHPEILVRLDAPAPGILQVFQLPMGGTVMVPVRAYLFGAPGKAAGSAMEAEWQAWLQKMLPNAGGDPASCHPPSEG